MIISIASTYWVLKFFQTLFLTLNLDSFTPSNIGYIPFTSSKWGVYYLLSPLYTWRKWVTQRLGDFPTLIQQVSGEARITLGPSTSRDCPAFNYCLPASAGIEYPLEGVRFLPHCLLVLWFQQKRSLSYSQKALLNDWICWVSLTNSPSSSSSPTLPITPYPLQVQGHSPSVGKLGNRQEGLSSQHWPDLSLVQRPLELSPPVTEHSRVSIWIDRCLCWTNCKYLNYLTCLHCIDFHCSNRETGSKSLIIYLNPRETNPKIQLQFNETTKLFFLS